MKPKRICKNEDCDKELDRRNKTGFCKSCYGLSIASKQRRCKICDKKISTKNITGFCRPCLDRERNKKRESIIYKCYICGDVISRHSKTGLCRKCSRRKLHGPKKLYLCKICTTPITRSSTTGMCISCYYLILKKSPRICKLESCDNEISRLNKSGFCRPCSIEDRYKNYNPIVYKCTICKKEVSKATSLASGLCKKCYLNEQKNKPKKLYFCKICEIPISGQGFTDMCHSCCMMGENNPMFGLIGEDNSNHIHGESSKVHYCKEPDCDSLISYTAWMHGGGRCKSCAAIINYEKRENKPNYKGGPVEVVCDFCGNPKKVKKSELKLVHHFCNKECFGKWLSVNNLRENNPNWQLGKSFETYPVGWSNKLKELIRSRDGYECQLCNKPQKENKRRLSTHHIDYIKDNLEPINLLALCDSCHGKTNTKRPYWTNHFQNYQKIRYNL